MATLVYYLAPNTVLIQHVDHFLELYQIFPDGPEIRTALVSLDAPTNRSRARPGTTGSGIWTS